MDREEIKAACAKGAEIAERSGSVFRLVRREDRPATVDERREMLTEIAELRAKLAAREERDDYFDPKKYILHTTSFLEQSTRPRSWNRA